MHIKLTIKKSGSFTFEQTAIYPEYLLFHSDQLRSRGIIYRAHSN